MQQNLDIIELILKNVCESWAKGELQQEQLKYWKDARNHFTQKIINNLNSFVRPTHRQSIIQILDYTLKLYPIETVNSLLPIILTAHNEFLEMTDKHDLVVVGPYFPQRIVNLMRQSEIRPQSYIETKNFSKFNMFLNEFLLECQFGVDLSYDDQLIAFYAPYHGLVRDMLKIAVNNGILIEKCVEIAIVITLEALPIRCDIFLDFIYGYKIPGKLTNDNLPDFFCKCNYFSELIKVILFRENHTLCNKTFYEFIVQNYTKVSSLIPEHMWSDVIEVCKEKLSNSTLSIFSNLFILRTLEICIKFNNRKIVPDYIISILSNYITKHLETADITTETLLQTSSQTSPTASSQMAECILSQDSQNDSMDERKRHIGELEDEESASKRMKTSENSDINEFNLDENVESTAEIDNDSNSVNDCANIMTLPSISKNAVRETLESLRDLIEL